MDKKNMIRYTYKLNSSRKLGPYERSVIWVHGCCFDCPGCIAHAAHGTGYREETADSLADWFLSEGKNHLTISGGEFVLQAASLSAMISRIREKRDVGVIAYTGFVYEDLLEKAKKDAGIELILDQIDILIDGPYVKELDHNETARGSSNQRIISLTDRYRDVVNDYYYANTGRSVDFLFKDNGTFMAGVPSTEQAALWDVIRSNCREKDSVCSSKEKVHSALANDVKTVLRNKGNGG